MCELLGVRRAAMAGVMLVLAAGLSACTTVEGTNALTDIGTFEREVGQETLKGLGILEREEKEPIKTPRAPLVLPKDTASLPAPTDESEYAELPEDSDKVQVDTTSLTEADLQRLRSVQVFDGRSVAGRPLSDAEIAELTKNAEAGRIRVERDGFRPLYLPPDDYFTTVGGKDLICLTAGGELVPLSDPSCPEDVRRQLASQ